MFGYLFTWNRNNNCNVIRINMYMLYRATSRWGIFPPENRFFVLTRRFNIPLIICQVMEFFTQHRVVKVFVHSCDNKLYTRFGILILGSSNVKCLAFYVVSCYITLRVFYFRLFVFGTRTSMFRVSTLMVRRLICTSNRRSVIYRYIRFVTITRVVNIRAGLNSFRWHVSGNIMSTFKSSLMTIVRVIIIVGRAREGAFSSRYQWFFNKASPLFLYVAFSGTVMGIFSA